MVISVPCSHNAKAFTLGGRRQPAGQRCGLAETTDALHKQQPDVLTDVVDVLAVQLVAQADRPHQRGVPLDDLVPSALVAGGSVGHQGADKRIVTHSRPCCSCLSAVLAARASLPSLLLVPLVPARAPKLINTETSHRRRDTASCELIPP